MLLWCFWKKVSFCYSAWLISGSHWIIVPCLQLIKATLTTLTTLPWFLWQQGAEMMLSPGFCSTLGLALRWQGFVRKSQPCRLCWQLTPHPASAARSLLSAQIVTPWSGLGKDTEALKPLWIVESLFLIDQPDPRSLELEHKHTQIWIPKSVPTAKNPFQYVLVGWRIFWSVCVVLRITYNTLILISTLEKPDLDVNFFSTCFYSILS